MAASAFIDHFLSEKEMAASDTCASGGETTLQLAFFFVVKESLTKEGLLSRFRNSVSVINLPRSKGFSMIHNM